MKCTLVAAKLHFTLVHLNIQPIMRLQASVHTVCDTYIFNYICMNWLMNVYISSIARLHGLRQCDSLTKYSKIHFSHHFAVAYIHTQIHMHQKEMELWLWLIVELFVCRNCREIIQSRIHTDDISSFPICESEE